MVDREGLVAGLEVEDVALAAGEGAAAAEDLAALEPADENLLVRLGDVEVLAVGLLMLDDDVAVQTLQDGVAGVHCPEDLLLPRFPPSEVDRGGAADLVEDLGGVAGMEDDEPHAVHNAAVHPLDNLVGDEVMGAVPPPDEDVGVV